MIAIDGSRFKEVNYREKNFTQHKAQARMQQLKESIERYLAELDRADRDPSLLPPGRVEQLKEKIAAVKAHVRKLRKIQKQLPQIPDQQISLTDPDARSMATSGRGTGMVGYNVQTAVDSKHHLIVAHEVTNVGHDRDQLTAMAKLARDALGRKRMTVLADRGYFKGEEILQCAQEQITTLVPKPLTSGSKAEGRFDKRDFIYIAKRDEYRCPAGERAIWRMTTVENGQRLHRYCKGCELRTQCTRNKESRRISRSANEHVLEEMNARVAAHPELMRRRKAIVEHPFGTLKAWMGSTHFLTKTLPRVRAEMSLHVLAYNLKRALQIFGTQPLIKSIMA